MVATHIRSKPFGLWVLDRLEGQAGGLLDVISLLDPDGIKEFIFKKEFANSLELRFPRTENEYLEARSKLKGRSLITRNIQLGEIRVHRIIQDVTRSMMSSNRLHAVFDATVQLVYYAWPFPSIAERHYTARWELCESLVPNIIRLYELYNSYILSNRLFTAKLAFAEILTDASW